MSSAARGSKPVPVPTPDSAPFWEGGRAGRLRIQRCSRCGVAFFYPRSSCPECGTEDVEWFDASGRATLHTYLINHLPAPGFDDGPYAIAVVELAEGPRMLTNIVGVEQTPEALVLDMPLVVEFDERDGVFVPVFRPAADEVGR